ncbi:dihydrolipoamide dehydrogenase [Bacillus pakistanensis]|uniref:Dihydrolipoyl dehydrogenase n=1 Tax=Rossellomorea pakistanensis TaxID=992288 RepID=A0ABS2NJ36_9BACI|nr:dihydrolipoyl dehydrogenase [Bacillus pakistanensis]MBM7587828.1 dihydrolipoamide dehydrogenase [Bacillus pakistanensis]
MVVGEITEERDLVVIGGGPGGYHAAIRANQLGLSVTLVEKEELGGVCLNKGCIPSKLMTHFAKRYKAIEHDRNMGLDISAVSINLSRLQEYKKNLTSGLKKGVESLCKANKIEILKGTAMFLSEDRIGIENGHQYSIYRFKKAIIATGSTTRPSPHFPNNDSRCLDSASIFELKELPEELIVEGSGYIELEVAMSFQALGSKVTLILNSELDFDQTMTKELFRVLKKNKVKVLKGYSLKEMKHEGSSLKAQYSSDGGETILVEGSHYFSVGKQVPNIEELGIDRLKLEQNEEGFLIVNEQCQTSLPHIYAIGDVTGGKILATKAIKQGKVAAEAIAGFASEYNEFFLPAIVHTIPAIASVGLTEEQAKDRYEIMTSVYPLGGNGFAQLTGEKEGVVKVIMDRQSDVLLGLHMMGSSAVELISSSIIGLEMGGRDEDFTFPFYPHPSINESLLEAVEALKGKAIHLPPSKQREIAKV